MQNKYQKLELTWIGKDEEPKLEPRILIEHPELSYGEIKSNNILIQGDNLLALKALEQDYAGKVKCIYIDPPYNTGNAFEHYDDGLEHSQWLNLMTPRLKILKNLLTNDGSIWISIDADESHYLKVLCDEVFGRKNFVDEVIWQRAYSPINLKKTLSRSHDTILVYAKNSDGFELNKLPRSEEANKRYSNPDNDERGVWKAGDLSVGPIVPDKVYEITTPSGRKVWPPKGYCWRLTKERLQEFIADNRIWFGPDGKSVPAIKRFLNEVKDGITAMTLWTYQEVGHNQDAKKEVKAFNNEDVFSTPKPERLIERILTLASNEGDLVLDSFLGSGTTAAVAHKMKRRWIGIEVGDHAKTHCIPRIQQVISGADQGGISKSVNWNGGGGYKFYSLAPCLLNQDKYGNYIISKEYNPAMLAAAMAKHEGFRYDPDEHIYWKQGRSSERDYIFTTQFITVELLDKIHSEMQPDESLLITCKAYHASCENRYNNISIKKIPQMLINRCEWKQDSDYSFNIVSVPIGESVVDNAVQDEESEKPKSRNKKLGAESEQLTFL